VLIDGTEEILPEATDPHIGLVYPPGSRPMPLISTHPLLDLRSIAVNPTHDCGWVNLNATLLHHLSQVAVADAVLAVPAYAQQDDLRRKATAFEQKQQGSSSGSSLS
jgi:hypothetical protein